MRRKPRMPTIITYSVLPTATAPNWWEWGRWPTTVLSTSATRGTEILDRIIGAARAQTFWWVGEWFQAARSIGNSLWTAQYTGLHAAIGAAASGLVAKRRRLP